MAWGIERIYAAATPQSIERCKAASIAFELLTPPDVPRDLLVLSAAIGVLPAFVEWSQGERALIEPASLPSRCPADAGIEYELAPDRARLLGAKWAAEQIGVATAYYSAETFGGRFEYEFAWEFGPRERVLARGTRVVAAERRTAKIWFFKPEVSVRTVSEELVFEITATDCICRTGTAATGGVLRYLLPSFGIESPNGYFKPHLRRA